MELNDQVLNAVYPPALYQDAMTMEWFLVPSFVKIPNKFNPEEYFLVHSKEYNRRRQIQLKEKQEFISRNCWLVPSSKGGRKYIVKWDGWNYTCDCLGYEYHGHCRHIKEVSDKMGKIHGKV